MSTKLLFSAGWDLWKQHCNKESYVSQYGLSPLLRLVWSYSSFACEEALFHHTTGRWLTVCYCSTRSLPRLEGPCPLLERAMSVENAPCILRRLCDSGLEGELCSPQLGFPPAVGSLLVPASAEGASHGTVVVFAESPSGCVGRGNVGSSAASLCPGSGCPSPGPQLLRRWCRGGLSTLVFPPSLCFPFGSFRSLIRPPFCWLAGLLEVLRLGLAHRILRRRLAAAECS